MYAAKLICSDDACLFETELVVTALEELDVQLCDDCHAVLQVLGVSFEASATTAILRVLTLQRERLHDDLRRAA